MGEGEYPPTHMQDETARMASGSHGDMFGAWNSTSKAPSSSDSPEAGGESNEDLEALWSLWWGWPGAGIYSVT